MYKKLEREMKGRSENEKQLSLRMLKEVETDIDYDISDLIDNKLVFRSWELEYIPYKKEPILKKSKKSIYVLIDYDEKVDYAIQFDLKDQQYSHYRYPFVRNLIKIIKTKDKILINQYLKDYFVYVAAWCHKC